MTFENWEETPEQKHERITRLLERNARADPICISCQNPVSSDQPLLTTEHGPYHGSPFTCVEGRKDEDIPWWQK
jgi:hypothetical protein